ncbi:MAG: 50S ribosomal protein L25 [Candidatus Schekmanbacteria bacterium]|nr:MAG: 50S ribosomal protein L25 [Candidatus Schekmanbacteria bacterium]
MQITSLKVSKREKSGKEFSKKLRKKGIVPAIVYGNGINMPIQLEKREISHILAKNPSGHPIVELEVENEDFNSHVILKETQRDPVTGDIIHADFLKIDMTKKVTITVPIKITGKSKGVAEEGGLLNIVHRELDIEALPNAIPEAITVDISNLGLNESIHVSDIDLGSDVKILEDPGIAIVSVVSPKAEAKPAEEELAEEAAEEAVEGKVEEEKKEAEGESSPAEAKEEEKTEK